MISQFHAFFFWRFKNNSIMECIYLNSLLKIVTPEHYFYIMVFTLKQATSFMVPKEKSKPSKAANTEKPNFMITHQQMNNTIESTYNFACAISINIIKKQKLLVAQEKALKIFVSKSLIELGKSEVCCHLDT